MRDALSFIAVQLSDFDFELPEDLIAQAPLPERSASRLLDCSGAALADRAVRDLPNLLRPGDLLVLNDTRVLKARLMGVRETGGRVEVLIERIIDDCTVLAQLRASHAPRLGSTLVMDGAGPVEVVAREEGFWRLRFGASVHALIEAHGRLPLPPYIERAAGPVDEERYQTVYARAPGAVAAPTAGLHFDADLLGALERRGVRRATLTLHVGAGTFQPIRTENLDEHIMHRERFEIPEALARAVAETRAIGARVVAVGTTTLRALESAATPHGLEVGSAETALFIRPGYAFQVVDILMTNFHLPRSTLLMLVSAFAGTQTIREAYRHAIAERYRFFSYGDAMLLARA